MKKIVKRHFQLLEVLIALFLVVVCALPVMEAFVGIYVSQKAFQREIERDHHMHLAHANLVEYLYREGVQGRSINELLSEKGMPIPPESSSKYQFLYTMSPDNQIKTDTKKILLNIQIIDKNDEKYKQTYKAFVKRIVKHGQETE